MRIQSQTTHLNTYVHMVCKCTPLWSDESHIFVRSLLLPIWIELSSLVIPFFLLFFSHIDPFCIHSQYHLQINWTLIHAKRLENISLPIFAFRRRKKKRKNKWKIVAHKKFMGFATGSKCDTTLETPKRRINENMWRKNYKKYWFTNWTGEWIQRFQS